MQRSPKGHIPFFFFLLHLLKCKWILLPYCAFTSPKNIYCTHIYCDTSHTLLKPHPSRVKLGVHQYEVTVRPWHKCSRITNKLQEIRIKTRGWSKSRAVPKSCIVNLLLISKGNWVGGENPKNLGTIEYCFILRAAK